MSTTIETKETDLSKASISCQLNNESRQQLENLLTRKDAEIARLRSELDQFGLNKSTIQIVSGTVPEVIIKTLTLKTEKSEFILSALEKKFGNL